MTFRQFAYRNVVRNKRTYAAYFFSSAFSVMIFFLCALFIFNPQLQQGMIYAVAIQAVVAAECIMYLFSFFFVLYSVSSFINTRKQEFGILIMLGMTKSQFGRMVFLENMMIGTGAIVTGICAGLLTGKLFLMAGSSFLGIDSLPFHLSWQAPALTIGSFILLFAVISKYTSANVRTSKLIELFQAGRKPKSEPKVSVALSIASAVLLAAGYYLAATATSASIIIRMFPVTGMTIAGTYLFYTQLGGLIIKLLKKHRPLFLNKTNIITVSTLAYRLKDNARMFFMVTIVSAVSFCAVGVFASINTLMKDFYQDYPSAIGYMAKDGSTVEQRHLEQIEHQLEEKGIAYEAHTIPVKYARIATSTSYDTADLLPVVPFSGYKEAIGKAGLPFHERPLPDNEALVMIGSQRDKSYTDERGLVTYTLQENSVAIRETGYTEHVLIPDYLATDFDGNYGDFGGVVVSDLMFDRIAAPAKTDRYTGFYVGDAARTFGMAEHLARNGVTRYESDEPYAIAVSGTLYVVQKNLYGIMLFVALLTGAVFFIAAGSFLYFRLYADLDYDRRQYEAIAKLGLTGKELRTIVTRQLSLLFFVPVGFAVNHSVFAFAALQSLFYLSIASETGIVLISFFTAQVLYFFFIRNRYLRNLQRKYR
ncbi:FtsX-like permease family protein [Paenibacillus alkalitolerans]|uniref:FtsX-like permease family protein n=1 Tax=Paenibacillus alkalitolerans TaxID=2799335 RepID=UPI0018F7059E|nr:ABC transporter permease [Paenibacillus alkalitolerans]